MTLLRDDFACAFTRYYTVNQIKIINAVNVTIKQSFVQLKLGMKRTHKDETKKIQFEIWSIFNFGL